MTSNVSKKSSSEFACRYCGKQYKTERFLVKHLCKQKKRYYEKDTKHARLGFHAYNQFMRRNYAKDGVYDKFVNSEFYEAFVRLGRYILDVDAIAPMAYIDYLIESSIPIDRWCRDTEYLKYVRTLTMRETPIRALERTTLLMHEWAIKHSVPMKDFFRKVSSPLAVQWINSGRLSPWVILNCESGREMLSRFTAEQKNLIAPSLNISMWVGKFARHEKEVEGIKIALAEEGL